MSRSCNNGYEMYKKSVMHVQSCSCANLNLLLFCCYKISLMLWSRNFATIVTWRHTSSLYAIRGITLFFDFYQNSWKCLYHLSTVGHFWVSETITFKRRLSSKSFLCHLASLWNRGLGYLGNGLIQCQANSEKTLRCPRWWILVINLYYFKPFMT